MIRFPLKHVISVQICVEFLLIFPKSFNFLIACKRQFKYFSTELSVLSINQKVQPCAQLTNVHVLMCNILWVK